MPKGKKGFQKGNKLSPGRPAGSVNMATLERRGLIEFLKEEGKDKFLQEMQTLKGKEYCKIYKGVIEIAFPKLARVETKVEGEIEHKVQGINYITPNGDNS
jgi:hypothetical protein